MMCLLMQRLLPVPWGCQGADVAGGQQPRCPVPLTAMHLLCTEAPSRIHERSKPAELTRSFWKSTAASLERCGGR